MIVELSESTRRSVANYQQYKTRSARLGAIQSTEATLNEVQTCLAALKIYPHLRAYFAQDTNLELQRSATQLFASLQNLDRQFSTDYDQQGRLVYQQRAALKLNEDLAKAWRDYALPQVEELQKRHALVARLPQVERNAATFQEFFLRLRSSASSLPSQVAQIEKFHANLQKVRNQIDQVGNLDAKQQRFLTRVNAGDATLAEVTPELLAWVQKTGMDRRIKLSILA